MNFRIVLGEVPEPEHMPVGRAYKDDLSVAIVQPRTPLGRLLQKLPQALTYQEWEKLIKAFKGLKINPRLAWESPEKHLPEKYWTTPVTTEIIPPELRA